VKHCCVIAKGAFFKKSNTHVRDKALDTMLNETAYC